MSRLAPLNELYLARLNRVRQVMRDTDTPVLLILDAVNILYTTGASNMTIFSTRTPSRYLLLFAEGPSILYDYFGCEHLSRSLPTISEVRPATGLCYTSANADVAQSVGRFAAEISDAVDVYLGSEKRIAIDRFPYMAVDALRNRGFQPANADRVVALARRRKMPIEIAYMREAMRRTTMAVTKFEQSIEPGMTESDLWAVFHHEHIASEGQYVTTRLMQSGPNTFPYFQECGNRTIKAGDLLCLDTDALGYKGYAVDFSRTFLCGDGKPTAKQKMLYNRAYEQLLHNAALIKAGASYEEIADRAWQVPNQHQDSRYYCIAHGLGMSGEFPNILHNNGSAPYTIQGEVDTGMVLCVESYIGDRSSGQGVKLEQQLLITESGVECMSNYPFDDRFTSQ